MSLRTGTSPTQEKDNCLWASQRGVPGQHKPAPGVVLARTACWRNTDGLPFCAQHLVLTLHPNGRGPRARKKVHQLVSLAQGCTNGREEPACLQRLGQIGPGTGTCCFLARPEAVISGGEDEGQRLPDSTNWVWIATRPAFVNKVYGPGHRYGFGGPQVRHTNCLAPIMILNAPSPAACEGRRAGRTCCCRLRLS